MKHRSNYTIQQLAELTGRHRTTLLNLINGRSDRDRPPLASVRDIKVIYDKHHYKCVYSHRLYQRIVRYYAQTENRDGKKKD